MTTTILLLEDDFLQRRDVKSTLEGAFDAEVQVLSCEKEFRERFDSIAERPPSVAILDIMLRWANASPAEVTPHPVDAPNPDKAGIRCAEMFRSDPRTKDVSVILYSVLGKEPDKPLPEGVRSVVKEHDCQNLIEAVRSAVG